MTFSVRLLSALMALTILAGCATNRLYEWGSYDALLYKQYKDATQATSARQEIEAHIAQLEARKQKVPPGLYAEVGTFYLQANDRVKAVAFYERERSVWPESAPMMKAMVSALERRAGSSANPSPSIEAPVAVEGESPVSAPATSAKPSP